MDPYYSDARVPRCPGSAVPFAVRLPFVVPPGHRAVWGSRPVAVAVDAARRVDGSSPQPCDPAPRGLCTDCTIPPQWRTGCDLPHFPEPWLEDARVRKGLRCRGALVLLDSVLRRTTRSAPLVPAEMPPVCVSPPGDVVPQDVAPSLAPSGVAAPRGPSPSAVPSEPGIHFDHSP